jgi:hypothetical protein
VSDFLHLIKTLRERFVTHQMVSAPGAAVLIVGLLLDDVHFFSGLPHCDPEVLRKEVMRTRFQDGPAIDLFQLSNVIIALGAGHPEVAEFLLPWSLMEAAFRSESPQLTAPLRAELIERAFCIFVRWLNDFPADGDDVFQTGHLGDLHTFATRDTLMRAMNLCIALYHALTGLGRDAADSPSLVALGRISSHRCEGHFGIVRSVLNCDDRWQQWLWAEVHAINVADFLLDLELHPITRRNRTSLSGVTVQSDTLWAASQSSAFEEYLGPAWYTHEPLDWALIQEGLNNLSELLDLAQVAELARPATAGSQIYSRLATR